MAEGCVSLEPQFICTYGMSGLGKTVDALYSFPHGLFVAPPGALTPAETVVGYSPRRTKVEAPSITAVTEMLARVHAAEFDAIVIDDFSLLAERQMALLERRYANSKNRFAVFSAMRDVVLDFRDAARRAQVHVLVNTHEQSPMTKPDGRFVLGGPRLPGQLPNDLPPATDICLRAVPQNDRLGWPVVYQRNVLDTTWSTKDRTDVIDGKRVTHGPMNIGEILRMAGYKIRRLAGLEWQEVVVSRLAEALAACPAREDEVALLQAATARIREKYTQNNLHIRWTLRDATDRAHLMRARAGMLSAFGVLA
mgnify:CR=1 FL=1